MIAVRARICNRVTDVRDRVSARVYTRVCRVETRVWDRVTSLLNCIRDLESRLVMMR